MTVMEKHESVGTVYYNPKLVSCPTCNAPKGEPCIGLIAPGCGPHLERYYRARAYLTHPSNQPTPQHAFAHVPRTPSCATGCTLNSNHQGDCIT